MFACKQKARLDLGNLLPTVALTFQSGVSWVFPSSWKSSGTHTVRERSVTA